MGISKTCLETKKEFLLNLYEKSKFIVLNMDSTQHFAIFIFFVREESEIHNNRYPLTSRDKNLQELFTLLCFFYA